MPCTHAYEMLSKREAHATHGKGFGALLAWAGRYMSYLGRLNPPRLRCVHERGARGARWSRWPPGTQGADWWVRRGAGAQGCGVLAGERGGWERRMLAVAGVEEREVKLEGVLLQASKLLLLRVPCVGLKGQVLWRAMAGA